MYTKYKMMEEKKLIKETENCRVYFLENARKIAITYNVNGRWLNIANIYPTQKIYVDMMGYNKYTMYYYPSDFTDKNHIIQERMATPIDANKFIGRGEIITQDIVDLYEAELVAIKLMNAK